MKKEQKRKEEIKPKKKRRKDLGAV